MSSVLEPSPALQGRQRHWVALLWTLQLLITAYYSALPAAKLGVMPGSDKLWHLSGYLILALPIPLFWTGWRKVCAAGILLALYGVGLEFVQRYVPGRGFELADMLANSTGVLCGIVLATRLRGPLLAFRWNPAANPENSR